MTATKSRSDPLLTYKQIDQWKDQCIGISDAIAEHRSKIKHLGIELESLRSKLTLAAPFAPEIRDWLAQQEVDCATISLTDAILQVLEEEPVGLERDEIRERVPAVGYPESKLTRSPNYFYTALRRLVERGDVVGVSGHFLIAADNQAVAP